MPINDQYMVILDTIYTDIFKRLRNNIVDVFLCGGASSKNELSTRDKLKIELEKNGKFRILYPEELFMDLLTTNKEQDLLSLEKVLARNCDYICIVCESVGSFVELGAFTNNSDTFDKVIALVQTKYKNQNSFLMLGPIAYIKSKNKKKVIFYNKNIEDSSKELMSTISKLVKGNRTSGDIDNIVGMHYFTLCVLYFFREIDVLVFIDLLKKILVKYFDKTFINEPIKFNLLFRPAIKLLYKARLVEQKKFAGKNSYKITSKGKVTFEQLYMRTYIPNKFPLLDKIRLEMIRTTYY